MLCLMTLSHVDMMDRSRALSDLSVVPSDSGTRLLFLLALKISLVDPLVGLRCGQE